MLNVTKPTRGFKRTVSLDHTVESIANDSKNNDFYLGERIYFIIYYLFFKGKFTIVFLLYFNSDNDSKFKILIVDL